MPKQSSRFLPVVDAVKGLEPQAEMRHFLDPAVARERGDQEVASLGGALRNNGLRVRLRRYEHVIVITREG